MAKVKVYNLAGKASGDMELNDAVFAVKPKQAVIHQVYLALLVNARQPWAHAKTKGEVRGGGRKPWRQKGTGRARHGSIRSPLWVGGGVTFGPRKIRNYKQKINQKMNQQAVRMILSDKVVDEKLIVLEDLPKNGKAKTLADLRKALPGVGKTMVLLTPSRDENLGKAIRNLKRLDLQQAIDVNVADLLNHQFVVISKKGIEVLEKRLVK